MRLLGYVWPKVAAKCPRCGENVFSGGLRRIRSGMRFGNPVNAWLFGRDWTCHHCGVPLRIAFRRGEYVAELA